ncbi:MAG: hypothetical protein J6U65_05990, partial [Bacteroidaceae bacterium]|nr:hypothetical protein [Bacteroidaceae bacterium]
MKLISTIFLLLLTTCYAIAQTSVQQGKVKTRGRMVNGKHIRGEGLPGTVVSFKDRNDVGVKDKKGIFSFPVKGNHFTLQSVTKKGYTLVDADAAPKVHKYSADTFYIVMDRPEQLLQDELDNMKLIRRTLNRQLEEKDAELEKLKTEKKISEEKYQEELQKLYANQENNEKLIRDMAKRYAQLDYDQLDEKNRRISELILAGRLTEADSLLRTKGDINSRIENIKQEEHLQAERDKEIQQQIDENNAAKAGTQKAKEDIASDCYHYFER